MITPADYAERCIQFPAFGYVPGSPERYPDPKDRYQLQFHKSTHKTRMMVLGNGAGKTVTAGVEVAYWISHDHPYQDTPAGPVQCLWICQKFQQMELLSKQLARRCLPAGFKFNQNDHQYSWPDGSTLTIISNDGDWASIQGIEADLVVIDEECDGQLYTELLARSRADKRTRYVISATATRGKRWMHKEVYQPWLEHHVAKGLSEDEAMREQSHEYFWVWPKGGVLDNPGASNEDEKWYHIAFAHLSPQERQARLRGGFVDLNQSPVFDMVAIDEIEAAIKVIGDNGTNGILTDDRGTKPTIMEFAGQYVRSEEMPLARAKFDFIATGGLWEGGRLTIYEMPRPDGIYVQGMDYAQGLQTGDADTAMVGRAGEDGRLYQVAEAEGQWGQTVAPVLFFMLGFFYNEALLVGEANSMGLGNMRLMWDLGYTYQYFREQKQDAKPSPKTDRLGYWKGSPLPINYLQRAIAPRAPGQVKRMPSRIVFRSEKFIDQARHYQHHPRNKTGELAETHDKDLIMGAEKGYHDDLISAAAGMIIGWHELPRFVKPLPVFKPGSMGDILGHAAILNPVKRKGPFAMARNR